MNALDELLASTGRVDDITPAGLRNGRAALESMLRDARTLQAPAPAPPRPAAARRSAGLPRKIIFAGTVAAAAAVAVTVVPGLSAQRPAAGHPSPAPGTAVTAAIVFREAAKAARAANAEQGGWPDAAYWRADSIEVRDGRTYHRDIWIAHNGDAVLADGSLAPGPQRISPAGSGFGYLGTKPGWLTWDGDLRTAHRPGQARTGPDPRQCGPRGWQPGAEPLVDRARPAGRDSGIARAAGGALRGGGQHSRRRGRQPTTSTRSAGLVPRSGSAKRRW